MDIHFGSPASFNYLWLVLCVAATTGLAMLARRRGWRRFATENRLDAVFPTRRSRSAWVTRLLSTFALVALVLGLTDIRWGKSWREVPQKGIEVVFALDVSRSMLAEDVAPNRLERAKQQIKDIVDELSGDRVGLVVFAGDAKRLIPLTTHYYDFKLALNEVGPHDVTHGGSNLGDAVRVAADSFLAKTSDHRAIVLFTDGEDHESQPVQAAKAAYANHQVRIFTVGLGDDRTGARVPNSSSRGPTFLQYDGQQVWSKLDGQILREMALVSDAAYIPAGTKQVDMSQVYRDYMAQVEQQEFETARIKSYIPRFPWFLGTALVLMLIEVLLGSRWSMRAFGSARAAPRESEPRTMGKRRRPAVQATAAVTMLALCFGNTENVSAAENDAYALARQASASLEAGDFDKAADQYLAASNLSPDSYQLKYNQAVARYRQGDYPTARHLFTAAIESPDRELESKARFNLGNCDYAEALKLAPADRDAARAKARSAISHYRGALAANSADGDARANIELAALLLRQLDEEEAKEQQQRQQQHSQQPNQSQENQKESHETQSQQQPSQGNSPQNDQNQQPSSTEQQSAGENSTQSESKESDTDRQGQSNDGSPPEEKHDAGQSGQQNSESNEQHSSERKQAAQEPVDTDHNDGTEENSRSSDEPTAERTQSSAAASKSPSQRGNSQHSQSNQEHSSTSANNDGEQPVEDTPADGQLQAINDVTNNTPKADGDLAVGDNKPMTREEAMKMLQSVRDRDLMRRLQNARKARQHYIPGDKDW